MGTRHLVCIYYNGRFVVAQYGHWDGYPSYTGVMIYDFITLPGNIDRLKAGLAHVKVFSSEEEYTHAITMDESIAALKDDPGALILEVVASANAQRPVAVVRELEFAQDTLYCEWIYVLDLDCEILEVYSSRCSDILQAELRFAEIGGVRSGLVKSFELSELPQSEAEFISLTDPEESEECPM